jgi:SPP1 family predicted phage head-tail adaptor
MAPIGQYRQRVQVERRTTTPDPDGGYLEVWVPLDPPTWDCAIQAASLRDLQRISGGAVNATATHLVRGRYHAQLAANARILFRDRTFEVQSVHDREQRQIELEVICHELTSGQDQPTRQVAGFVGRSPREQPHVRLPAD